MKAGQMMKVATPADISHALRGSVVAIGNFDGVHGGHQAVLAAARGQAAHIDAPLIMMTFEPHPRTFKPDCSAAVQQAFQAPRIPLRPLPPLGRFENPDLVGAPLLDFRALRVEH